MKISKSVIFIILSVLILGCNNDTKKNEKKLTQKKPEIKAVKFESLLDGKYKIKLNQINTISKKTSLPYQNDKKPLTAESTSEWELVHEKDEYNFKLLNISYGYDLITHGFDIDTKKDDVSIKSLLQGVEVNISEEGKSELENAQNTLKKIKGFSFSIKKDPNRKSFVLSSDYKLPLESLKLKNNLYSPDQEVKLHLNKKKIISLFSKILIRPDKSMLPNEEYKPDDITWKLSSNSNNLYLKTTQDETSFYVTYDFDNNKNFTGAYYKSLKSTSKKMKASGMNLKLITNYKHEANLMITTVKNTNQ